MKRCTQCGLEKPEDAFEMQPSRGRLRTECRECRTIAMREWRAKRKSNPPKPKHETKQCNTCHEVKPLSEFSPGSPGYVHGRCKVCEVQRHREQRRQQYQNNPTARFYWPFENEAGIMVKRCSYCHAEKPLSEFSPNGKKGRHGKCKECDNALQQARYKANPEKYREAVRVSARKYPDRQRARGQRWRAANREHCAQYSRQHRNVHHERYLAYDRIRHSKETSEYHHMWYVRRREYFQTYVEANKERMSENARKWRQNNPDKHAEKESRRRAHKRNAPRIEKIDRKAIIERDKWTCYLCGVICTPKNVTLDHVIPLFHGGSHTSDNLRVACRPCNCRKGHKLGDFLA